MSMTAYVGKSGLRLENSGSALPFVPGKILNLDRQKGYPIFGYTDLRFLPSRINQAYPLNSRSIVVSIDGCGVSSENALGAMLHSPPAKDYVEVIYYQEGETSGAFYRAFVPMYSRPTVEVEWTKLVRENPAVVPDRYGRLLSYAAAFTFVALVAYFKTSPLGRRLAQEQQECIRQHSGEAIEITC